MRNAENIRLLSKAGFTCVRRAKKTTMWELGGITVHLGNSLSEDNPHTTKEVQQALRRAEEWKERNRPKEPKKGVANTLNVSVAKQLANNPEFMKQGFFRCTKCPRLMFHTPGELLLHMSAIHPDHKSEIGMFANLTKKPDAPLKKVIYVKTEPAPPAAPPPGDNKRGDADRFKNFRGMYIRPEERLRLFDMVLALSKEGKSQAEIAAAVTKAGLKTASGVPWRAAKIAQVKRQALVYQAKLNVARRHAEKPPAQEAGVVGSWGKAEPVATKLQQPVAPAPVPVPPAPVPVAPPPPAPTPTGNQIKIPTSMLLMLEDPELTIEQKVNIVRSAGIKIPASIQLMLEDPELNVPQKFGILMGLFGK